MRLSCTEQHLDSVATEPTMISRTKRDQYRERMLPGVMETARALVARQRKALIEGGG